MTDQMQEPTNSTGAGFDRRSMLAKAAAAGAIAWSAPLIVSSPAFAGNGVCTPSCAPGPFTPVLKVVDVCEGDFTKIIDPPFNGSALDTFIGNSNKMAILSIQAPATVNCPCGGPAVPSYVTGLGINSKFWKMGSEQTTLAALATMCANRLPNNPDLNVFPLDGYDFTPVLPALATGFTQNNSFALNKEGAIQNGTFKTNVEICIAVGCPDEVGGDIVYRRCRFTLCFSYTPAGSCSRYATTLSLFTLVPNSCAVGCSVLCPGQTV